MSFKLNMAIFKSTKPDSKVDFNGRLNIKPEELDALCRFVYSQTPDQYGSVQVPISGWRKKSSNGNVYVSAVAQPPRDWVDVEAAAKSLADATGGVVTAVQGDVF